MKTIREQLEESINDNISWYYLDNEPTIKGIEEAQEACEQVVEDIAIQFNDWLMTSESDAIYEPKLSTKELFEIFKKEKGL